LAGRASPRVRLSFAGRAGGGTSGPPYPLARAWEQWDDNQRLSPTPGASFSPESATNMGKALDGAVDILGIDRGDETKREAVARFIIKLAEIDGGVDAASLRDQAVMALGGSVHLASMTKDGQS
jgi:hypothetical protein